MLYNYKITVYSKTEDFVGGEVSESYTETGNMYVHFMRRANEQMSGKRKQDIKNVTMIYQEPPFALAFRDIIEDENGVYYRLETDPVIKKGATKRIYEVQLTEDLDVNIP
jgi:hypothetical protein